MSKITSVAVLPFASIADAVFTVAEKVGEHQHLAPGAVAAEMMLALAAYTAKYGADDCVEACQKMVADFSVVVALCRAAGGNMESVRDDMARRQQQVAS